jgi:ADP-heptose:LPS heptosyltransferase
MKILVIKLGALGDFVQAMGPAAAIRVHHPEAEITLLTTKLFAELARKAPYFDRVWIDERPGLFDLGGLWRLRQKLRDGFDRVYDLQTSSRSTRYYRLMGPDPRPEWSGIVPDVALEHANPQRNFMHTIDRQKDQLAVAGITEVPLSDLSWAATDPAAFELPLPYLLLVPGGAKHRPAKRWPAGRYSQLAGQAAKLGITPVVIGGPDERDAGREIARNCPAARDLIGQTSFGDIIGLAQGCGYAVGNDTGPMHLIVAAGAPATVLYSAESDPALTQPRGTDVTVLQRPDLGDLSVDEVAATIRIS